MTKKAQYVVTATIWAAGQAVLPGEMYAPASAAEAKRLLKAGVLAEADPQPLPADLQPAPAPVADPQSEPAPEPEPTSGLDLGDEDEDEDAADDAASA